MPAQCGSSSADENWGIGLKKKIASIIGWCALLAIVFNASAVESDNSYTSPQAGPGYQQPQVGEGYKKAETGPGYEKAEVGPGYQKAQVGPGFVRPEIGSGYNEPEIGPGFMKFVVDTYVPPKVGEGFVRPGTDLNADKNTGVEIADKNAGMEGEKTGEGKKGPETQKSEIDQLLVGEWRVFSDSFYPKDGGFKYRTTPNNTMEIRMDGTWHFDGESGDVRIEKATAADWERWGIKQYDGADGRKITFEGWKGAAADGPVEGTLGSMDFFWAIYQGAHENVQGQVWQKFGPAGKQRLVVEAAGDGTVASADGKINCGEKCSAQYDYGSEAGVAASAKKGSVFMGWLGACSGSDSACTVKMDRPRRSVALFAGGCTSNEQCAADQSCNGGKCEALKCGCGEPGNHVCMAYACCSDDQCGAGATCDDRLHQCVAKSACTQLVKNGDSAKKLDLVFVGDSFDDAQMLRKSVEYMMDHEYRYRGVFSVTPFRENAEKFNVSMVLAPDYRHLEDGSPDPADYHRFVAACERDTVVVLSRNLYRPFALFPVQGSRGGAAFISIQFVLVRGAEFLGYNLLHELGHAIGGLADEYVELGRGTRNIANAPNCAPDLQTAKQRWGGLVGIRGVDFYTGVAGIEGTKYYKSPYVSFPELPPAPDGSDMGDGGCSYDWKNIRPTAGSIMKNQFETQYDFGPVNERALEKKLEEYE